MLVAKNLVKVYKSKTGVYVKALDQVSLTLPEKGMVFILGKSGSGKSTLLNVLGGLDSFDSGSITFNGKETSGFKQADFDSYRNTYVGFIFQEYNLLEDFTVGANIALAMELQGEKATNERLNEILDDVELTGLGSRKPNELSGGQKQRVAIARALVKNPDIIMADEPTGALDSNTGRQIFETLKKLSETKLVLVVSHDKDFAMRYADRIIELADGKIIDDISVDKNVEDGKESDIVFAENEIIIRPQYQLTNDDLQMINDYLSGKKNDVIIKTNEKHGSFQFKHTVEEDITSTGNEYKQIKSRLSIKNSFKIGSTGLRHKKVKLVFTILLAVIAFSFFGLSDVMAAYDKVETCYNSIIDSNVSYLSFYKEEKRYFMDESYYEDINLNKDDIAKIKELYDVDVTPVYSPPFSIDYRDIFESNDDTEKYFDLYCDYFSGLVDINSDLLNQYNYEMLVGSMPSSDDEICISAYSAGLFLQCGVVDNNDSTKYLHFTKYEDILGYKLTFEMDGTDKEFTISGIVDTKFDYEKYLGLLDDTTTLDTPALLMRALLEEELGFATSYSLNSVCFLHDGYTEKLIKNHEIGTAIKEFGLYLNTDSIDFGWFVAYVNTLQNNSTPIYFIDEDKDTLENNELIIPYDFLLYAYEELASRNDPDFEYGYDDTPTLENTIDLVDKIKLLDADFFDNIGLGCYSFDEDVLSSNFKIVGVSYFDTYRPYIILSDNEYNKYAKSNDGYYSHAAGVMVENNKLKNIIKESYSKDRDVRYSLVNNVTYELEFVDYILSATKKVFLYVGLFIGVFAALMLMNFITTSISYKRHDIGILRAIGARFSDVFKIFFSESLIIAGINFVLSTILTLILSIVVNSIFRSELNLLVTIMNFSFRQVGLLLAISFVASIISTILPVLIHASRKPIDAIRDK